MLRRSLERNTRNTNMHKNACVLALSAGISQTLTSPDPILVITLVCTADLWHGLDLQQSTALVQRHSPKSVTPPPLTSSPRWHHWQWEYCRHGPCRNMHTQSTMTHLLLKTQSMLCLPSALLGQLSVGLSQLVPWRWTPELLSTTSDACVQ